MDENLGVRRMGRIGRAQNPDIDLLLQEARHAERKAQAQVPKKPQWIPFHKALHYLVYDSRWGAEQPAAGEKQFNEIVSVEVRERLARGEILSRGRRGWGAKASQRATEEIAKEFWVDAFILPWGTIALADANGDYACKQDGGGEKWSGILLDQVAVRRVWPPRAFPAGASREPTALSTMVEETRAKCEAGTAELAKLRAKPDLNIKPEPAPRPSFEMPPEFDYPYPKAVLRAEVMEPKGQRTARDGFVYQMGVRMSLKNAHSKLLHDCSIFVRDMARDGKVTEIGEALRFGKETTFDVYPRQDKNFGIVTRDISDPITPAPFLIKLASRDLPLAENSQYVLTLELRSRYPFPTLAFVQIDTAEGLDVHVRILDQKLSETPL